MLGLSIDGMPDVALPAGLVALYLFWRWPAASLRTVAKNAAPVAIGVLTVRFFIAVGNAALTGETIPISSNAGIDFYTGYAASADGVSVIPVGLRWERLVSRVPQPLSEQPSKASRWWFSRAMQEMAMEPSKTALRAGRKALALFNGREFRNNICFHFMQSRHWSTPQAALSSVQRNPSVVSDSFSLPFKAGQMHGRVYGFHS